MGDKKPKKQNQKRGQKAAADAGQKGGEAADLKEATSRKKK